MGIRLNGRVTTGTRDNLVAGVHSSAMPLEATNAVLKQTVAIAERLTDLYGEEIALGEVGVNGTGLAENKGTTRPSPPASLLYGRVQSGKTVSMILTTALCLDNGFRVVVVLTSDNVALVKQTAQRFKDLAETRVFAGVKEGAQYEWEGQESTVARDIPTKGLVLVCAKNSVNLPEVIRFLQNVGASKYPVLVLDDEADAATPDTTLAQRSMSKPKAPKIASRIYRLVITNDDPGENGFSLGQEFPSSLYVQVTATPYVLFLQRGDQPIRPVDTFLLEPGVGYCGGEAFFGKYDPTPGTSTPDTLVLVGATEAAEMKEGAPKGLLGSIEFFLLSACALSVEKGWPADGFNHLSHTSAKTEEHKTVAGYITNRLNQLNDILDDTKNSEETFRPAYTELLRSIGKLPTLNELLDICRSAIQHKEVLRVNSKVGPPAYGPRLNFLIGGNILGRGLTISDLLVTYYVREAKIAQMDTVWQHARMFGYRQRYIKYMRVYLPPQLATRFREIHEGEEALRRSISNGDGSLAKLIRIPSSSRATRSNALDPRAIRGFSAGRNQVNPQGLVLNSVAGLQVQKILERAGVPDGEKLSRDKRPMALPSAFIRRLIATVPVAPDDAGVWDADLVTALINSYLSAQNDELIVYVRLLDDTDRTRARLSGPEIALLRERSPTKPSLALLYVGSWLQPEGWYPTLVMPKNCPAFVFEGGSR